MSEILNSYLFAGAFFFCAVIFFTRKKESKIKKQSKYPRREN